MLRIVYCTASALEAMLAYVDPPGGPRIAYDDDSLADKLAEKLRTSLADIHGSKPVSVHFSAEEELLSKQFTGVARNIADIFSKL